MYKEPERYSFAFHSYVQLTMLENHIKLNQSSTFNEHQHLTKENNFDCDKFNINIMERSLYSAKYCFLENLFKENRIKAVEYEILDKWYTWMLSSHDCSLDMIFYLRTKPETCYDRLYTRGRPEEVSTVSLDYLQSLHDLHENWLIKINHQMYKPVNVIVIDADQSFEDVCRRIETETKQAVAVTN